MPNLSLLFLLATASLIIYRTTIRLIQILRSPLNKIPDAHFSVRFTRLWLLWQRFRGKENTTCHEIHHRLGPIVRLGPREVSVNCIEDGVQVVYGTNWNKTGMYSAFENYGHAPMFSIQESKPHAERRRIYSHVYSKTTVNNSEELKSIFITSGMILRQKLQTWAAARETINVLHLSEAYCMDVVSAYLYGPANATNWLEDDEKAAYYLPAFKTMFEPYVFFLFSEVPRLVKWGANIGINLIPRRMFAAMEIVHPFIHDLTKEAVMALQKSEVNERPVAQVLQNIRTKLGRSKIPEDQRFDVLASDLLDQVHAAHEATGIVLTFAMWELTRNPVYQAELREELRSLVQTGQSPLQSGLLGDIILETARLYPAAFGPLPRFAPMDTKVAGFEIPAGTVVSASPYLLGRDADIFPEPDRWNPRRWSVAGQDRRKIMNKSVWLFTSGSRACIGEHVAIAMMKSFVADVYMQHQTVLAKESNMKQLETFMALPADGALYLRFESIGEDA